MNLIDVPDGPLARGVHAVLSDLYPHVQAVQGPPSSRGRANIVLTASRVPLAPLGERFEDYEPARISPARAFTDDRGWVGHRWSGAQLGTLPLKETWYWSFSHSSLGAGGGARASVVQHFGGDLRHMRSQPQSFLSIGRLKKAKSRIREFKPHTHCQELFRLERALLTGDATIQARRQA